MRAMARRLFLFVALAAAGCAHPPTFDEVAASLPPPPPGAARIFVYRAFEPYQSLSWVPVFFNGANVGAVGPGHVILRDVPAGTYNIAVASQGLYPNQNRVVTLAPGQAAYAKITSFKGLNPTANRAVPLTTFVVTLVDPVNAQREIGQLRYMARRQKGAAVSG